MQIQRVDELGVLGLLVNRKANLVTVMIQNSYFSQSGHYPVKLDGEILAALSEYGDEPDRNWFLIAEFPNVREALAPVYMSKLHAQLQKLGGVYDLSNSEIIKKLEHVMFEVMLKVGPVGHGNHLFHVRF